MINPSNINCNKEDLPKLTNPENANGGGRTVAMSATNDVQNGDMRLSHTTKEEEDASDDKVETETPLKDHTSKFRGTSLLETLLKIESYLWHPTICEDVRKKAMASIPYFPGQVYKGFKRSVEQCIKTHEPAPHPISFAKSFPDAIVTTKPKESLENMLRMLREDQRQLLSGLQGEQKLQFARMFYQEKMRVAAKEERSAALLAAIGVLSTMMKDVRKTIHCLNSLAGMSQAEETCTGSRKSTQDAIADAAEREMEGMLVAGETSPEALILFQNKGKLDCNAYFEADLENPNTKKSYENLIKVAEAWKVWILQSKEVPGNPCEKDKLQFNNGVEFMQKILTPSATNILEGETCFPSLVAGEVGYAQPAIHALLEAIGDCWTDCRRPDPMSPFKTKVKRNPIIPPTDLRPRRIVDFCLEKPGRFQLVMFDFAVKLVFEMKPLLRKNSSPTRLDEESFRQVVASLSKYLYQSLNLHGCGTSSFATGLTGTLVYIIVIKLELQLKEASIIGENVTKLKLMESQPLPLMTKECFESLINKSDFTEQRKEILNCLSKSLYGENGDEGMDKNGIPLGIRTLWELIPLRRNKLFGPDYTQLFREKSIGDLLGTGSFSVVFGLKNDTNVVLKVPTFSSRHVVNEMRVLMKLNTSKTDGNEIKDAALPVFKEKIVLKFSLGNVMCMTDGLVLSPKGIPVVHFLQINKDIQLTEFIDESIAKLRGALDYIHRLDIFHLDVTPKNLVVVECERQRNVVLVDFGCACNKNDQLFGFIGTPSFVHKDIYKKYPGHEWHADDNCVYYDYFGLALTLCALHECGKATWDMGKLPFSTKSPTFAQELKDKVGNRQEKARSVIKKSKSKKKDLWKSWLSYETTGDMVQKKQRVM